MKKLQSRFLSNRSIIEPYIKVFNSKLSISIRIIRLRNKKRVNIFQIPHLSFKINSKYESWSFTTFIRYIQVLYTGVKLVNFFLLFQVLLFERNWIGQKQLIPRKATHVTHSFSNIFFKTTWVNIYSQCFVWIRV